MKITIVLGAFFPLPPIRGGAVEKVWFALAREFARRGHEIVQISRAVAPWPRSEVSAGVHHLRVPGFDAPASLLWLKFLDLIYSLRAWKVLPSAEVVVTNTFWLPILLRNSKHGKVYVHVARFPKGQMRMYRHAARLQAPSTAVAKAIAAEVPQGGKKIRVIPYPAPQIEGARVPPPLQQRAKTILYLGRIHPEKGVHLLVAAFLARARDLLADWQLMIVGPSEKQLGGGGSEYLECLRSAAAPEADHVLFSGPIFDPPALEREFQRARLFVYPSLAERGESFGLAPLEAMTHGCAVLVSNLECFRDFVREGETGFIFNHRTADPVSALRDRIDNLCVHEPLLARTAEAGARQAAEYSLSRVADRFLEDFETVLRE